MAYSPTQPTAGDSKESIAKKILILWRLSYGGGAANAPQIQDSYRDTLRKILKTLLGT